MKNRITVRAEFGPAVSNAKMPDTPMVSAWSFIVKHNGELREAITVRTYYSQRGSGMQPVRACIWISPADSNGEWHSGRGSAGGYGYHKESQAIADAIDSAGITLWGATYERQDEPVSFKNRVYFGGTGSSSYQRVFEAIARAAGYHIGKGSSLLVSH